MKHYGVHVCNFNEKIKVVIKYVQVVTGNWLIEGFPQVVLFDISSAAHRLDGWKGDLFEYARIGIPYHDRESNDAVLFGFCVFWFIGTVSLNKITYIYKQY